MNIRHIGFDAERLEVVDLGLVPLALADRFLGFQDSALISLADITAIPQAGCGRSGQPTAIIPVRARCSTRNAAGPLPLAA